MPTIRKINDRLTDVRIGVLLTPEEVAAAKEYARREGFGNWASAIEAMALAAVKERLSAAGEKEGTP